MMRGLLTSQNHSSHQQIFQQQVIAEPLYDLKFQLNDVSRGSSFPLGLWPTIAIGIVLFVIIIFCVVGNLFVISAILMERDLRSRPQYYLIFSLAVADLMVGLTVTPLMAWFTLKQVWELGVTLCDFWISVDVLVCTSSILHLVAIALDRYWSITDIYYSQKRTPKRIFTMLMLIWVVSLLISVAPIFGWKDDHFVERVRENHVCLISQEISYQVFSTATAFYIPLCAIIIVYYKIMRAAKKRFRRERDRKTINRQTLISEEPSRSKISYTAGNHDVSISPTGMMTNSPAAAPTPNNGGICCGDSSLEHSLSVNTLISNAPMQQNGHIAKNKKYENSSIAMNVSNSDEEKSAHPIGTGTTETSMMIPSGSTAGIIETRFVQKKQGPLSITKMTFSGAKRLAIARTPIGINRKRRVKENVETKRERKAWRTLAIITGTFIACWTPFFLISLYRPICGCPIPPLLEFVFGWLGYLNSALNPVIYTVFSTDFRMAFKRILKRLFLIK